MRSSTNLLEKIKFRVEFVNKAEEAIEHIYGVFPTSEMIDGGAILQYSTGFRDRTNKEIYEGDTLFISGFGEVVVTDVRRFYLFIIREKIIEQDIEII